MREIESSGDKDHALSINMDHKRHALWECFATELAYMIPAVIGVSILQQNQRGVAMGYALELQMARFHVSLDKVPLCSISTEI